MGKRKLIKIITVQGVLSKKETLGPELKASKPGINGMGTRKAIATNQILSYGGSVCYSSEIRKLPYIGKKKSLPFSMSSGRVVFQMHPVPDDYPLLTRAPWYLSIGTFRKENMASLAVCLWRPAPFL